MENPALSSHPRPTGLCYAPGSLLTWKPTTVYLPSPDILGEGGYLTCSLYLRLSGVTVMLQHAMLGFRSDFSGPTALGSHWLLPNQMAILEKAWDE